jgi:hypothetical protein
MPRSTLIFVLATLLAGSISGQSAVKPELLPGDWHCCGIMTLTIDDVAHFQRDASACKNNDCLNFRWIINKKGSVKLGWQKGCKNTWFGFGFKASYKWIFRADEELFTIKRKDITEEYRVMQLTDKYLTVKRLK